MEPFARFKARTLEPRNRKGANARCLQRVPFHAARKRWLGLVDSPEYPQKSPLESENNDSRAVNLLSACTD
jgi:hypothetical protein